MKLSRLNKREKYAVIAGIGALCLFILIQFIIFPFIDRQKNLERRLHAKEKILTELKILKSEYENLTKTSGIWRDKLKNRPRGFTLFSFMDELAQKAKVEIAYMKPSSSKPKDSQFTISKVELKLQKINMKKLTPFLHMVETSPNMVFIRRISITKKGKEGFVDVIMQVETFEA